MVRDREKKHAHKFEYSTSIVSMYTAYGSIIRVKY